MNEAEEALRHSLRCLCVSVCTCACVHACGGGCVGVRACVHCVNEVLDLPCMELDFASTTFLGRCSTN